MIRLSRMVALVALASALAPSAALAQGAGWSVSPTGLTRTIDTVSARWQAVPDDDDVYSVRIDGCGDAPPYASEDVIHFEDEPLAERIDAAHDAMAEMIAGAVSDCALPESMTARVMDGFAAAFGQFAKIRK